MNRTINTVLYLFKTTIIAIIALIILNRLYKFYYDVLYPYPREYRDGAIVDIANEFRQNRNPFSISNVLPHNYTYGIIPPYITGMVSKVLTIELAKIQLFSSLVLIITLSLTVGYYSWKKSRDYVLAILGFTFVLIYYEVSFRPEIYAILLTTILLIINQKSPKIITVCFSAFSTVGLYYIKPYFILIAAVIFLYYMQVKKPILKLITFTIFTALIAVLSTLLINYFFPMYFPQTFTNNLNMYNTHRLSWMQKQTIDFFISNWSIILFLLFSVTYSYIKHKKTQSKNIFLIYIIVSSICLTFSLGQHTGTYLTYYYHLLPIPIILYIINFLSNSSSFFKYIFIILLLGNFYKYISLPTKPNYQNFTNWDSATNYIMQNNPERAYLSPHFITLAIDNSWPVHDNGQTEVFYAGAVFDRRYSILERILPQSKLVTPMFNAWTDKINNKISHKEFSLITLSSEFHSFINDNILKENYVIDNTVNLPTNLGNVEFWKPKFKETNAKK